MTKNLTGGKSVEDYQERVVAEKKELDERLKKLTAFIISSKFNDLTFAEQKRMSKQKSIMFLYSDVLGERIAVFQEESAKS